MLSHYLKKVLCLPILLFLHIYTYAQTGSISGKILDDKQAGLAGTTVLLSGASGGVLANDDGSFLLSNLSPGKYTVLFEHVGYISQQKEVTVTAGATTSVKIVMIAANTSLTEVVVIGYGSERKKDVTGAIASITSKDFQQGQITTPEQLIAGKVAGVSVISNSGAPGAGSTIRIRGGASINGSNDPLIVLDGVPLNPSSIAGAANPLDLINPNDIERVDVLKDASAAAIYGNRASNGVILITTKKGQRGKPKVSFTTQLSVAQLSKEAGVLSPGEFRDYVKSHDTTAAGTFRSLLGEYNTNWQKVIYQTAVSTDNNLSVSGSVGKKLPYRASVGYTNQDGILKTSNLTRYSGDLSLAPVFFDDHLKVAVNLKGAQVKQRFANEGAIGAAVSFDPTQPVYSGKNLYGGYFEYTDPSSVTGLKSNAPRNPLGLLEENHNVSSVYRTVSSLAFDYKLHFLPDLHINVNLGYDGAKGDGTQTIPEYAASNLKTYTDSNGVSHSGYSHYYKQISSNLLLESFLNYNKNIAALKSHVDVVAGYANQKFRNTTYNYASYFADGTLNPLSVPTYASSLNEYILTSLYGRINWVYNDKYILTATVRNDYSTKFAPADRSGVFSSAAFAWRINDEKFLQNSKVISNLKLRLEYGVTGNQEGIGSYDYLSDYSQGTATGRYQLGQTYYYVYRPGAYYPGRTWETTTTQNIAIDYGLWGDRITGSVDLYFRKTKNLLARATQSALTNFSNQITANIGNMKDEGVEFNLNAKAIDKQDMGWTVGFNITYNHNSISNLTALSGQTSSGLLTGGITGGTGNTVQINQVGANKYSFYLYEQVYDATGKPIDGLFVDRKKDGVINQNDLYINKSPDPKAYLGFSTDFRYKRWGAGLVARASFGNYVYNNVASYTGIQHYILNPIGTLNNGSRTVLSSDLIGSNDKSLLSDYWLENGSFLRMDNIHLSYNLGKIIAGKGDLRISANVQNAFLITKYQGVDPEVSSGIDNNFYPRPRTYVLGVNWSL
ncbi:MULTISPECIES: SusC/RagA family TonB-linked outer membrane protein [Niastella]|uniref:SusC/RagA family TonB-linked outer membrane protein n=1 Tax=Niastella soli TaxID=2821487 RepID=A0ABS3Z286_9BACT|nr:SusC/RagA family TonB-linked outer membrane protein [Niastella soli]MBO9204274.1 SusC/RagA family TonB-linked outer membrane protein [Niastella soli]